jgi:hypothetical protein
MVYLEVVLVMGKDIIVNVATFVILNVLNVQNYYLRQSVGLLNLPCVALGHVARASPVNATHGSQLNSSVGLLMTSHC